MQKIAIIIIFLFAFIFADKADKIEMIKVPAGSFEMGQILPQGMRLGFPIHKVTFTNDILMGKYEITNSQFCKILNYALKKDLLVGDYENNISVKNKIGDSQELFDLDGHYNDIKPEIIFKKDQFIVIDKKENRPVYYVSWYGAAFYCNILSEIENLQKVYNLDSWQSENIYTKNGYRLPTEAEWEYASRYDNGQTYPWGDKYISDATNFGLSIGHTTDVGSYEKGKSKLGFYDFCGNVEEWVNDWYGTYPTKDVVNPLGPKLSVYKEKRGGSWYKSDNNFPFLAYRYNTNYCYTSFFDIGFRVAKNKN